MTFYALPLILLLMSSTPVFDFNASVPINQWRIENDGVMGGVSTSSFRLNNDGHAVFAGHVSLENNGGFASVQHQLPQPIGVSPEQTVKIRLKGDGKRYQFRVKESFNTYYSYIHYFETTGEWQTVAIPLADMQPWFRGRKVDAPAFNHQQLVQVRFLIANKREEDFQLMIDAIALE